MFSRPLVQDVAGEPESIVYKAPAWLAPRSRNVPVSGQSVRPIAIYQHPGLVMNDPKD